MDVRERTAADIAELKIRIETAEEAVSAARECLGRLGDLLEGPSEGVSPQATSSGSSAGTRLIPLVDWPKHHPWPPVGGLRHLVFNAEHNGFAQVICRMGSRVIIDEAAFFEWAARRGHGPVVERPNPSPLSQVRRRSSGRS
jgi:hypothetical protein